MFDIGGKIVKEDERYVVKDNTTLNNLIISSTNLNPQCSTSGHKHEGQEEVYIFVKGCGSIVLDNETKLVNEGDVVLIEDGVYHKVHAGNWGCQFICVFNGGRNETV